MGAIISIIIILYFLPVVYIIYTIITSKESFTEEEIINAVSQALIPGVNIIIALSVFTYLNKEEDD